MPIALILSLYPHDDKISVIIGESKEAIIDSLQRITCKYIEKPSVSLVVHFQFEKSNWNRDLLFWYNIKRKTQSMVLKPSNRCILWGEVSVGTLTPKFFSLGPGLVGWAGDRCSHGARMTRTPCSPATPCSAIHINENLMVKATSHASHGGIDWTSSSRKQLNNVSQV